MPKIHETQTVKLELRLGTAVGSDGRRGRVVAEGDVPVGEFIQWLERLRFVDLPRAVGGVFLYAGERLLVGHDQVTLEPETSTAPTPSAVTIASAATEKLELRLATLREQVTAETDRVRRAREELADLRPHLERERARATAELARLEQDVAEHRRVCLQQKADLQGDVVAGVKVVTTTLADQLEVVKAAMHTALTQVTTNANDAINAESAMAKMAHTRRVEAQATSIDQLALFDALGDVGAQKLLASGSPGPKDKIYEGLGSWLGSGGLDKSMGFVERLIERFAKPPGEPSR